MSDNVRAAERVMNQDAVYWEILGYNPAGEPVFDDPIEIKCWWQDIHEVFIDAKGNDVVSNSMVIVDRDLIEESFLWLGTIENLDSQVDPSANKKAYSIRKFGKTPDRKARKFLRQVWL